MIAAVFASVLTVWHSVPADARVAGGCVALTAFGAYNYANYVRGGR
jgi:hypothetical protein